MRKVLNFVKDNKKIIIVIILIIVLIGTVYFIDRGKNRTQNTSSISAKSAEEKKLSQILSSMSGVGVADVMITQSGENILGVVVVCEGANNIMTRNDILNAVSTALNIDKKIIAIYAMNI